jgi:molybdopterin/thiamine biosynthesis adenylyltransferase
VPPLRLHALIVVAGGREPARLRAIADEVDDRRAEAQLPGVIGLLEAVETIKVLLGIGAPLVGRLLTYDALGGHFREFKLRRDADCRYCGEGRDFPGYVDYEAFCGRS